MRVSSVAAAFFAILIGGLLMVAPAIAAVVALVVLAWLRAFTAPES